MAGPTRRIAELSVLTRQCLRRRIAHRQTVATKVAASRTKRNEAKVEIDWHFTTEDARTRIQRLYPKIKDG